jgi:hypothetical protein
MIGAMESWVFTMKLDKFSMRRSLEPVVIPISPHHVVTSGVCVVLSPVSPCLAHLILLVARKVPGLEHHTTSIK